MSRIGIDRIGNREDTSSVTKRLSGILADLEDQLNTRPNLYSISSARIPSSKTGDVIFSTLNNTITGVRVKVGKDTFAKLDGDSIGVTLVSLGVSAGAAAQITSGAITLTTLGVHAGAQAQITAGAITQSSLGITLTTLGVHAGAQAQITAGAITQSSLGITLTTLGVHAGAQAQITAGAITAAGIGAAILASAGDAFDGAVTARVQTGHFKLRYRGFYSGASMATLLTADGDWGFHYNTGSTKTFVGLNRGGTVYAAELI